MAGSNAAVAGGSVVACVGAGVSCSDSFCTSGVELTSGCATISGSGKVISGALFISDAFSLLGIACISGSEGVGATWGSTAFISEGEEGGALGSSRLTRTRFLRTSTCTVRARPVASTDLISEVCF